MVISRSVRFASVFVRNTSFILFSATLCSEIRKRRVLFSSHPIDSKINGAIGTLSEFLLDDVARIDLGRDVWDEKSRIIFHLVP